jgi:hypothetical protein
MRNSEQPERPGIFRKLADAIRRLFRREVEPPEDPHAYVMAPKKPRPSGRSAAAVAELPEDFDPRA